MKYCVYKHVSPEGKIYIGITHLHPLDRWKGEYNAYFSKDIKYFKSIGKKFEHYILNINIEWVKWNKYLSLEETNIFSEVEASKHENYWIKAYHTNDKRYGYNLMPGGTFGWETNKVMKSKFSNAAKGHIVSEETRAKISKANKGKNPYRARAVKQYDLNGDFIARYFAIAMAAEAVGTSRSAISQAASGRIKSAGGYKWEYDNDKKNNNE